METDLSESQSSEHSAENQNQFDLKDVYTYLLSTQARLTTLLERCQKLEENNLISQGSTDEHELLRFKTRFLNLLLNQIRNQQPQQWRRIPSHVQLDIKNTLKEEVKILKIDLHANKKKLEEDKKHLAELEERIKNLKEMADNFDKVPTGHEAYSVTRKAQRLNRMFNRSKVQLNDMLEELFPVEIKDLLQNLCEIYFSDNAGDPYITVEKTDPYYKYVEALLVSNIITRHPHDNDKIRLNNFYQ